MTQKTLRIAGLTGLLALSLGFAWYCAAHPMDFRVYYFGAQGVASGTRPMYGPESGLGWPMHYRYPPLFLVLFTPLSWVPIGFSAALWVLVKIVVLWFLTRRLAGDLNLALRWPAALVAFAIAAPYVVQELRYGNAQLFVFAVTAWALIWSRLHPVRAAAVLAFGISLKVWPLFFVPYLWALGRRQVVAGTLVLTLVFALLPGVVVGFARNLELLSLWAAQESRIQAGTEEIWFPNQSLRGTLMRYLTVVDYAKVPDSNYPQVHFAALAPEQIRSVWLGLAGLAYAGVLVFAARHGDVHPLAFASLGLLQPFTQKYALITLLWPALLAGVIVERERVLVGSRALLVLAAILSAVQPLVPGSENQRLLQVIGMDFWIGVLLTAGIVWSYSPMVQTRVGRTL